MDCLFEKNADGLWKCRSPRHGYVWPRLDGVPYPVIPPRMNCSIPGPGDRLHDLILRLTGEGPTTECGCESKIVQMNAWGPAGCREHLDEIVDWLLEEARKRGHWRYLAALPGARFVLRRLILVLIGQRGI
jgi:hypothetical protein